ncbi:transposase [Streptomyces sp. NPDC048312]|uniref:transposase n=1 Tax=Streptomyces sp. NPDC048312 TaxID=3155485 RepID=UPI00340BE3A0
MRAGRGRWCTTSRPRASSWPARAGCSSSRPNGCWRPFEGEITDHLGYDKHDAAGKNGGNRRNGTHAKSMLTDVGPVEATVSRDREGSWNQRSSASGRSAAFRHGRDGHLAVREGLDHR